MSTAPGSWLAAACAVIALGCSDGAERQSGDAGGGLPPPTWSACSLATEGGDADAECTEASVPLDWNDPGGTHITYFVKRYRPKSTASHADLWLIAGGPGLAGNGFESAAAAIAQAGQVDVYMPDHRGTGRSSRLSCAMAEQKGTPLDYAISTDEMKQCLSTAGPAAATTLTGFSPSNAARDIGWMVSQTRTTGRPLYVFGVSYGTYLTLRYLQLFPKGADAIVLDSLCPPGGCFLSRIDAWTNDAGKAYFAVCGGDALCSSKLGADPWAKLGAALDALDQNACPEAVAAGFTRGSVRSLFNQLVNLGGFAGRALVPVFTYRIARCSAADRHALARAGQKAFPPAPDAPSLSQQLFSQMLTTHIALSELYDSPPPSLAEQQQIFAGTYVSSGRAAELAELYDLWPRYPSDPLAQTWPTTTIPMLVMRGEADYIPAALVDAAKPRFSGEHQQYVVLPRSQHHVITNSPTTTPDAPPCGQTLLGAFVADPTATLDLSCLSQIQPYSFSVDPALATNVFGTADAWEGDPGP